MFCSTAPAAAAGAAVTAAAGGAAAAATLRLGYVELQDSPQALCLLLRNS